MWGVFAFSGGLGDRSSDRDARAQPAPEPASRDTGIDNDVSRRRDWKWWLFVLVVAQVAVASTHRLPFVASLAVCVVIGLIAGHCVMYFARP